MESLAEKQYEYSKTTPEHPKHQAYNLKLHYAYHSITFSTTCEGCDSLFRLIFLASLPSFERDLVEQQRKTGVTEALLPFLNNSSSLESLEISSLFFTEASSSSDFNFSIIRSFSLFEDCNISILARSFCIFSFACSTSVLLLFNRSVRSLSLFLYWFQTKSLSAKRAVTFELFSCRCIK